MANHNGRRQCNEPIRNSKQIEVAGDEVRENACEAAHNWFWFEFWLVDKAAQGFLANHSVTMENQGNREITFDA